MLSQVGVAYGANQPAGRRRLRLRRSLEMRFYIPVQYSKMKCFNKIVLFACAIVVMLLVLLMYGNSPQPFGAKTSLGSSSYEGFGRMHNLEYTTYPENVSVDSIETTFSGARKDVGEPVRLPGYAGLQTSPDAAFAPLDIYSQASGAKDCPGSSLSNSMGPLCLNSEQIRLLQTRGGNLTGGDSRIG
jgi:hypothetical protein